MALISEYNILSSKINKLENKINHSKELNKFEVNDIKGKTKIKLEKFIKKEEERLYFLKFNENNIDQEIDRILPLYLNKFLTKDYWKRREAIQTYRVNNRTEEATKIYYDRLKELDLIRKNKEKEVRNKIYKSLSKYLNNDVEKYNLEKEKSTLLINEYKENLYSDEKEKLNKINSKYEKVITSLEEKKKIYLEKISHLKNVNYSLDEDVVLKVENLTKQFGGLKAVDDLSFEVKNGEIFGLIGPNGAGKTTVFNCITQFYKPTKGNLYFKEKSGNVISLNDYVVHDVIKKGIVRTFQNVEVVKEITVLENLLIAAHTQYKSSLVTQFLHLPMLKKEEKALRAKAIEVLEFMGLSLYKDLLAWGLPYGVLKKIEIARTLMNNPQLIILDEPAAGLNDSETKELKELIKKIQKEFNCTILLVEHDMGLVMDICDTVCAISFGKLLAIGSTEEIQNNKDVQAAYLGFVEEDE